MIPFRSIPRFSPATPAVSAALAAVPVAATCIAAVAAVVAPASPLEAQSLDDWLSVSSVGEFVWSPDGDFLYYTSNAAPSGTHEIFRVAADGSEPTRLGGTPAGARPEPAQSLTVSGAGDRIVYVSARLYQGFDNIWSLPADGGEPTAITFNDAVIETSPTLSPDGRTLAYQVRTPGGPRIYLKDLAEPNGWPRLFTAGGANETGPSFSPDGRWLAFSRGGDIWIRPVPAGDGRPAGGVGPGGATGQGTGDDARPVVETAFAGGNGGFAWSPDGTRFAFTSGRSGWSQVAVVEVRTGRVTPITWAERDHEEVAWSPDGRWLAFTRSDEGAFSNQVVIAAADGTGELRPITSGPGIRSAPAFSPSGRELAWIEESDTRTPDLWKASWGVNGVGADPATGPGRGVRVAEPGTLVQVTRSMGRIEPATLSEAEEVYYAGPDNLPIPTLLYRPRDFDAARSYPVIVRLHGHPGQWNHSFEMMRQYWVRRGFVVVAPNPRGSVGFGQGFHDLHIADYGGVELRDVLGVVPFLEGLGYIDMTRKATWGGSGGGYMSFVIATEAPDVFQAQVIRAPVSDWRLLANDRYAASGRHWTAGRTPRRERSEFGGSYAEIPEEYDRRSPINFVDAVEVPQLLLQGLRDASVPPRQSQVWVERMRELGKGDLIEFVEYPDEDHSLRRYKATMRDILVRMESFLAETLRLPELGR